MASDFHRKLVEESSDIVTVVDEHGEISYVSQAVERTLGYDTEELIGEVGFEYQHPDDRETVADAVEHVLDHPDETEVVETRFRRTDGSWCWIEATLQNRTEDPDIGGILISSRDISGRKRQERRYRDLADEYTTLLDAVEDSIFFVDVERTESGPDFRFRRLNRSYEEQTGLTTADVRGKTPEEVFGEDLGSELRANYHRCARSGGPIGYQEELPVETGARFWQTNLAPVVSDGEITQIVGITRNVTDRVERERRLRTQKEQLDEFAGVVSHDLRNPLNVASARAQMLAETCPDEAGHLDVLLASLDRMDAIVSDTLTLAREGQVVGEMESIDLVTLVGSCWRAVETEAATIEFENDVRIRGDPDRLSHVFENLFRNAVEHGSTSPDSQARRNAVEHGSTSSRATSDDTVEHGSTSSRPEADDAVEHGGADVTVRVGLLDEGGLYVEDTGPGIPPDSRQDVFAPGETSASDGTGFGLTIVRRIAEAHGWGVTITEGSDGGARFEFTGVEIEAE
jgi:PAS domain S-box-containing protein